MKKYLVAATCTAALALGVFATDLLRPQAADAGKPASFWVYCQFPTSSRPMVANDPAEIRYKIKQCLEEGGTPIGVVPVPL